MVEHTRRVIPESKFIFSNNADEIQNYLENHVSLMQTITRNPILIQGLFAKLAEDLSRNEIKQSEITGKIRSITTSYLLKNIPPKAPEMAGTIELDRCFDADQLTAEIFPVLLKIARKVETLDVGKIIVQKGKTINAIRTPI